MTSDDPDPVLHAIATQGYALHDGFLDADATARYRAYALGQEPAMRPAATGRRHDAAVRPDLRSDRILWVDPDDPEPVVQDLQARFEDLRRALNESLLLGLFEIELHVAHYPVGARYGPHVDRFRDDDARVLSAVLYLNDNWTDADGGALRLYAGRTQTAGHVDIAPRGGRLVLFLAEAFLHEVLPARRDRWSITGWFRRR